MQNTVSHLGVLFNTDFHALAIELRIPVRHVLFISEILSDSEGVSCLMLLFWLQTFRLQVVLTTVIPCLEVPLFSIYTGSNVSIACRWSAVYSTEP